MIWALLAILGVPIWLIVGALTAAIVSRRRFKAQPGVFRLKVRDPDQQKWPRRSAYGRVVHDVLVVNSGVALVRTTVRGVHRVQEHPLRTPIAGFDEAKAFELTFDDGSRRLVAADQAVAAQIRSMDRAAARDVVPPAST